MTLASNIVKVLLDDSDGSCFYFLEPHFFNKMVENDQPDLLCEMIDIEFERDRNGKLITLKTGKVWIRQSRIVYAAVVRDRKTFQPLTITKDELEEFEKKQLVGQL